MDDSPETDLETAYRQALQAMDAAEQELGGAFEELMEPIPEVPDEEPGPVRQVGEIPEEPEAPSPRQSGLTTITLDESSEVAVTAREIVESMLFVGGDNLTAKKMANVLGGSHDQKFVERVIDDLNQQYQTENRPYEIQLQEGGYRLEVKTEYDSVRNRVFGLGPKEVKLSAEALEVLAVIAYLQPITRAEIEQKKSSNVGSVLRQLLRRELIITQNKEDKTDEVRYETTPRFLEVFGIVTLDELPRSADLSLK